MMHNAFYAGFRLLACLLLTGCAGAPSTAPMAMPEIPASWHAKTAEASIPNWAGLIDPQLAALQEQADRVNRDIVRATIRWRQAETQSAIGALRLQADAGLGATTTRALRSAADLNSTVNTWNRSYGATASASYELDLWDRLAHSNAAQTADAAAAWTDVAAMRLLIHNRVAEVYWTLGAITLQQPLVDRQLQISEELLRVAILRVREGAQVPVDIETVSATVLQARARRAELKSIAQQQRHILALLLDQPLPGPTVDDPKLPQRSPPRWTPAEPSIVFARRPDVQRGRLLVDGALARLSVADAERYPKLVFAASLTSNGFRASDWLRNPLGTLAANLVVPLVDWRRLDLQRDNARTELDLAALSLRDTIQTAAVEIENLLVEDESIRAQLSASEQRLKESAEANRVAALRFAVGAVARDELLKAETSYLEAQQSHWQLQLRALFNLTAQSRALADGDFQSRASSPAGTARAI